MAKPHERAISLILAILFLATSVGTAAAVFWMARQENEAPTTAENIEETLSAQDSLEVEQAESGGDMLQGTKLAEFTPIEKVDQLQSVDIRVGEGEEVKPGATITAHYTGALAKDGTIFQSSLDTGEPATFPLSGVIKGWTDGVPGMRVGGKRRLIIPAAQAYGEESPSADIPANSDLVFDIELMNIDQQGQ